MVATLAVRSTIPVNIVDVRLLKGRKIAIFRKSAPIRFRDREFAPLQSRLPMPLNVENVVLLFSGDHLKLKTQYSHDTKNP
jgi:hypothetical protein